MKDDPRIYSDPNKLPYQFWNVYKNLSDEDKIEFMGLLIFNVCCELEMTGGVVKKDFENWFRWGLQDLDNNEE